MRAVGLDIGTTSISGVVIDTDIGAQLDSITVANDAALETGRPWERVQDPEKIFSRCLSVIESLGEKRGMDCLGLAGQMHGIVYLDAGGRAVSPLYTWEDGRGDLPLEGGETYAQVLARLTGRPTPTGFGLTTHFYNLKNGLVPDKAACLCSISDYVAARLCNSRRAVSHPSNAAGLGLYDLNVLDFDFKAVERAGIDPALLPEKAQRGVAVGHTYEDVPVAVPIGDNQAGIFGSASDEDLVINIGTSSQVSMITDAPLSIPGLECRPFVNGKYALLGAGLCGGSSFRLLNGFFREVCAPFCRVSQDDMYDFMENAAGEALKLGGGPVVKPFFRGTREEPGLRGSIEGISMENLTPGSLALGFYQGVCRELLGFYKMMPEEARDKGRLVLSGNAARNNRLLAELIKDVFHRPAVLTPYREEAATGAAIFAAEAVCPCTGVRERLLGGRAR